MKIKHFKTEQGIPNKSNFCFDASGFELAKSVTQGGNCDMKIGMMKTPTG